MLVMCSLCWLLVLRRLADDNHADCALTMRCAAAAAAQCKELDLPSY